MQYRDAETNDYPAEIIQQLLERLMLGESMRSICSDDAMPSRRTLARWCDGDDELAAEIIRAREIGFLDAGDAAVEAAKNAVHPMKGRLAFDAEKWRLERLSQAFAAKPQKTEINARLQIDGTDVFGKFAGALERAASAIATRHSRTINVVSESEAGSDSA